MVVKQPKTTKLVFIVKDNLIIEKEYKIDFYGGFALSQKHKTIDCLHKEILKENKDLKILEVSRKSKSYLGQELSAFNLKVKIGDKSYPVECVYQSSKVFNKNIQFIECLNKTPLEAKQRIKEEVEKNKLCLTHFKFNNKEFSLVPNSLFYDYLYLKALSQNKELGKKILEYDAFTDIEFNHKKQYSSQARSCALFKYLSDNALLEMVLDSLDALIKIYKIIVKYSSMVSLFE